MEPFKNVYNQIYISKLSNALKKEHRSFKDKDFINAIFNQNWEKFSLKERMRYITLTLGDFLPEQYPQALKILLNIAPGFTGLPAIHFPDFVEVYGQKHFEKSLEALKILTSFSTSEFAIRPYLDQKPKETFQYIYPWLKDPNEHIRRLVSEGSRPRLPWGMALKKLKDNPEPLLTIFNTLKKDPSLYVRKSVANSLNDITKDNPEIALDWMLKNKNHHHHTDWIIKHAARTLLKKGNTQALKLFNLHHKPQIKNLKLKLNKKNLEIGETLEIDIRFKCLKQQLIRFEYELCFLSHTQNYRKKIFQLTTSTYEVGEHAIPLKFPLIHRSTRTLYPGTQKLGLIANGIPLQEINFKLNL